MAVPDHHIDDELILGIVLGRADAEARAHVEACERCHSRAEVWAAITAGTRASVDRHAQLPPVVVERVVAHLAAIDQPYPVWRRVQWGWQVLVGQIPLVRRGIWAASALMFALGVLVLLVAGRGYAAETLALLAPLTAAVGLAMIYGPEVDAALELAAATPTSPRTVLLARFVLVTAFVLCLAVAASSVAAFGLSASVFWAVIGTWLGPLLLLSSLSLALAVLTRPGVGIVVALGLWTLRALADTPLGSGGPAPFLTLGQAEVIRAAWGTNALVLLVALVLITATLTLVPRRMRFA